jgi:uncharacterized protein (TIGR00251 family)
MEAQQTPKDLVVRVKVKPNSGRLRLTRRGEELVLEVTSPPREGRANQEILRELPKLLGCEVSIVSGLKSKRKTLLLSGITEKELEDSLTTG